MRGFDSQDVYKRQAPPLSGAAPSTAKPFRMRWSFGGPPRWEKRRRPSPISRFLSLIHILVETSARHVHLSQQDLETLFGEGYQLTNKKDLSQPGQFACTERVDVVGSKKTLAGVTILGPVRGKSQVELSLTDARSIGVDAPIRESGDVAGSGSCRLVGPKGEVELKEGVIAAKRHIHMTPADAEAFGVKDKDVVSVRIASVGRSLVDVYKRQMLCSCIFISGMLPIFGREPMCSGNIFSRARPPAPPW